MASIVPMDFKFPITTKRASLLREAGLQGSGQDRRGPVVSYPHR
jgi:hypothetical protein